MEVPVDVGEDSDAQGRRSLSRRRSRPEPGRATRLGLAAGAVLAAGGWAAAAVLLWRTQGAAPAPLELAPADVFPAGYLDRAEDYRALTRPLWAARTALELVVLGLLAWRARGLAQVAARAARGRIRTGLALGLAAVLAVFAATLPLGATGQWWRRRYGLSEQGYGAWLGDELVATAVRAVLVSLAVAGVLALGGRLGRRWWLAGGPALCGIAVAYVLAEPLAVQPLFNRFEPVERALAAEIRELAQREGVTVGRVEVADASRRTTSANAYVAGLGPTKRVVLYDTLLDGRFARSEILAVSAHELAHVERRHLWKGLAWFALLALPGVAVLARLLERRGGAHDPALVPLGLLVAAVWILVTVPLANAVSRRYEAEADRLAVAATRDPAGAASLYAKLAASGLGDPDPPGWVRVLLSTHPSALERVAAACAAAPPAARDACIAATRATRGGS
jgi:STE24 endopeptidase